MTAVFAAFTRTITIVIHRLCAHDPRPELRAWLRVVVRRAAIDYMRANPEFERATQPPNRWISLATLTLGGARAAGADSLVEKRKQVLDVAARDGRARRHRVRGPRRGCDRPPRARVGARTLARAPARARGAQYLAVITAVFAGHSHTDVAAQLATDSARSRIDARLHRGAVARTVRDRVACARVDCDDVTFLLAARPDASDAPSRRTQTSTATSRVRDVPRARGAGSRSSCIGSSASRKTRSRIAICSHSRSSIRSCSRSRPSSRAAAWVGSRVRAIAGSAATSRSRKCCRITLDARFDARGRDHRAAPASGDRADLRGRAMAGWLGVLRDATGLRRHARATRSRRPARSRIGSRCCRT